MKKRLNMTNALKFSVTQIEILNCTKLLSIQQHFWENLAWLRSPRRPSQSNEIKQLNNVRGRVVLETLLCVSELPLSLSELMLLLQAPKGGTTSGESFCVCVRPCTQTKCLRPRIYLTVPDKVTIIMTIKKPRAILSAAVIVSCDHLPSTLSRHILHNPPQWHKRAST